MESTSTTIRVPRELATAWLSARIERVPPWPGRSPKPSTLRAGGILVGGRRTDGGGGFAASSTVNRSGEPEGTLKDGLDPAESWADVW